MLSGKDVHKAFTSAFPYLAPHWDALPNFSREGYELAAHELNNILASKDVEDRITITAIRCQTCDEMLDVIHAENHACWLPGERIVQ